MSRVPLNKQNDRWHSPSRSEVTICKVAKVSISSDPHRRGTHRGAFCALAIALTHNGGEIEHLLAQISVSFDLNLRPSRITINALCKKAPSQLVGYPHSRGEAFR
jgi:hypothetical protein